MKLEVFIAEPAERDLDDIWLWIARDDIEAADRFTDDLRDLAASLSQNPERGSPRGEFHRTVRSLRLHSHLILYRIEPDRVMILRVVDGHRNLRALRLDG